VSWQRWLILIGFVGVGCGAPAPPVPNPRDTGKGEAIYRRGSCPGCHGSYRQGSATGPALVDLDRHWREDTMVDFLRNPRAVRAVNDRVARQAEQYKTDMPGLPGADDATLRELARYVLSD
jgi:mono/diheme cytochrome c family protein